MTQEEIIEMARQAGFVDYELDDGTTNAFDKRYEAFTKLVAEKAIKEALAQPEQEPVAYIQVSKTGNVMACAKTGDFYKLPDKTLLYTSPQPAPVQEPVAWHKGDSVYWHTSPDLNDWIRANGEPLYTNPPPCPTCEALARTVMLDQTSHDAQRKPLTDEEVEKIIKSNMSLQMNLAGIRADIEAAHGIKE